MVQMWKDSAECGRVGRYADKEKIHGPLNCIR